MLPPQESVFFDKVVIVGTGLLGGSLALDLKRKGLARSVVGVNRSRKTSELALELGVVDAGDALKTAVHGADLIVIATPMQAMPETLAELAVSAPKNAIISDVGSVKSSVYAAARENAPALLQQLVLCHPIAGGERSGVRAAKLDLFRGKHLILTRTDEVSEMACKKVKALWQAVGADVVEMTLSEHDAVFARTSHLPHVIAFGLVHYLNAQKNREQLFDMAAAGFYDFTRIASSDAEMWRDICLTNHTEVLSALAGFKDEIDSLSHLIGEQNGAALLDYFDAAKDARDTGLLQKAQKSLARDA